MNTVYIYDKTGEYQFLQFFDAENLSINLKLSDVGYAEFNIPVITKKGGIHDALSDIAYLAKMNRVKIWRFNDWVENIIFEGYIANVKDETLSTHVICATSMIRFEERMLLADLTINASISSILNTILTTINATEDTWITVNCTVNTVASKQYSAWEYMLDILKDLSDGGYQFDIRDNVLYFWESIGVDRSMWDDRVEFLYEYNQGRTRNIDDFSFTGDIRNIKNAVYSKNTGGTVIWSFDTESIESYFRQEEFISVNGDVASETSKYLADHKNDTVEISIMPSVKDFSLADIWDIVWIHIDRGDARGKYIGSAVVQTKEFIDGDLPEIKFWFSTSNIRTPTILEKIKMMSDEIRNLKNI